MRESNEIPPRWADRFLAWYCNREVIEQVQGDAHELFYWRLEEEGLSRARRAFVWDVVRLFKWSNVKRNRQSQQLNHITMFKNYFKIGLRNLWKQKMPSTINVIGLSLAVACCLVSFKWIESKFVKDQFHEKTDQIYLVTPTQKNEEGDDQRYGKTAMAVSDLIGQRISGVTQSVYIADTYLNFRANNRRFGSYALYVTDNFFDVFSFEVLLGDISDFSDPRKIVINESEASAFFGDEHPIGQSIEIEIDGAERSFEVAAVVENAPDNSSIRPAFVVNFKIFEEGKDRVNTNVMTFLELNPSITPESLNQSLAELAETKSSLTPERPYLGISLEHISTMAAKNGTEIYGAMGGQPPMAPVILLTCIGAFMLLLSTFNYVNIATMMAMRRVKEIGVRKVIGSKRSQLIGQFLTENLILCVLAIVLGCLVASAMFLPWFNGISGANLTLDLLGHRNLWYFLATLLVFITLASGAYPAFYISSFKPVVIFRGQSARGGKRRLTGALLTFQMILAIITIVAGIMFVQTNRVNESRDWGYNQYDKIVAGVPDGQQLQTVIAELSRNPNVTRIAASRGTIGSMHNRKKVEKGEQEVYANILGSDYLYPQLMNLNLLAGSFFDKQTASQNQRSLIVNKTFMDAFDFDLQAEEVVTIDSVNYTISGVVEDFHYASFSDVIRPAAIWALPDSMLSSLTIEIVPGTMIDARKEIYDALVEMDPDNLHHVFSQETIFDGHFEEMNGIRNIMLFTATLSVLLAAMGLFGLVSLNISSRIKDFSIKKVLGASLRQLSADVYKRFALILGLATLIGGTISVFLIGILLDSVYGYHEQIGVIPLCLAGVLLMSVAAMTINTQVLNVKKMNPAETLRAE